MIIEEVKSEESRKRVEKMRLQTYGLLKTQREKMMQRLPQMMPSGVFLKGRPGRYNGCVVLQVEHFGSEEEKAEIKARFAEFPQVMLVFEGADGRSIVAIVRYARPDGTLPEEETSVEMFHAHAYRHALKTLEPEMGIAIKIKKPEVRMTLPMPYDPDIYYNPAATTVLLDQPTEMPQESLYQERFEKLTPMISEAADFIRRKRYISEQYDLAFRQALEAGGSELDSLDFKPLMIQLGRLCSGAGIEEEECVRWTMEYLKPFLVAEQEIRQTMSNAYVLQKGFGKTPVVNQQQMMVMQQQEFMERRYILRRNVMTGAVEYIEKHSFCHEFRPVTEVVRNSMALNAQLEGIEMWDKDARRIINSDRVTDYKPIENWLGNLRKWDGKDRIKPLMQRVPTKNVKWVELGRRWFLSMVAHWQGRDKEHGNTLSPLLIGEQGCGKSTFVLKLLPPELRHYYTDSIDLSKRRDCELALSRYALINLDEFDQFGQNYQGFLKHLQQKASVSTRRPYGAQVEEMKRYASFIATSNHTDLLTDPSGSRRFICVNVEGNIDNSQPIEYDQLYAQAIAMLDGNERYWLTREEEVALIGDNDAFRQRSLAEDLFHKFFREAQEGEEYQWMTAGEIYNDLGKKSGRNLPTGKSNTFGRFLRQTIKRNKNCKRGVVYALVALSEE